MELFNYFFCNKVLGKNRIEPILIIKKNKRNSTITSIEEFISLYNEIKKDLSDETYYKLTQNIRNLKKLSNEDFEYIKKLPKENLIEII